jgi:hypothetical protein
MLATNKDEHPTALMLPAASKQTAPAPERRQHHRPTACERAPAANAASTPAQNSTQQEKQQLGLAYLRKARGLRGRRVPQDNYPRRLARLLRVDAAE